MALINSIDISPPLINTSCAWASSLEQLQALYDSPYTGAVTTRTSTVEGFKEDASNTFAFAKESKTSINSYGYSPHPLSSYISWITQILSSSSSTKKKPFIISIVTTSELKALLATSPPLHWDQILIEFNLSCPNIPGAPPKGYTPSVLQPLLSAISQEVKNNPKLTIGLKLPPFVYEQQFTDLANLLVPGGGVSFLTCTNTLGSSLVFSEGGFALPTPLGGLAGEAIHSLALGNVYTWSELLKKKGLDKEIVVIGVGGVTSKEAVERMKKAGAGVVGCATLLGKEGVECFEALSA